MHGVELACKVLAGGNSCLIVRAFYESKLRWLYLIQPDTTPRLPKKADFAAMREVPAEIIAANKGAEQACRALLAAHS